MRIMTLIVRSHYIIHGAKNYQEFTQIVREFPYGRRF